MPAAMTLNVKQLRDETVALLHDCSDAPTLEAELLIEHVSGISRTQQHIQLDIKLPASQIDLFLQLRQRRTNGEPLAYVLNEAHFWTLKLTVSPAVLIPRPETELVVERALMHISSLSKPQILDLGTGSGAIALAIAKERSQAQVTACDISATALEIARANATANQLTNVQFCLSSWFSNVPQQSFDVIVSNPPYIDIDDPHVEAAVRRYEPHAALFAKEGGLHDIRAIIMNALPHLHVGGWLILEHGWQQASRVRALLESQGFNSVASHIDLAGHERVTEAQRPLT